MFESDNSPRQGLSSNHLYLETESAISQGLLRVRRALNCLLSRENISSGWPWSPPRWDFNSKPQLVNGLVLQTNEEDRQALETWCIDQGLAERGKSEAEIRNIFDISVDKELVIR